MLKECQKVGFCSHGAQGRGEPISSDITQFHARNLSAGLSLSDSGGVLGEAMWEKFAGLGR